MIGNAYTSCVAFQGSQQIAAGSLREVAAIAKTAYDRHPTQTLLFFDDSTSEQIEVDLRGSHADVATRIAPATEQEAELNRLIATPAPAPVVRGPGRPKLGVVAREVTLLPRHWEWLARQSGGASVALRKLVDEAKKGNESRDRTRAAQESAYRFLSVMAGNQSGFEEATRALFAADQEKFEQLAQRWPSDVRNHAIVLASRAFGATRYQKV
ncbi:MAG: DUF2239 family protein [Gemmatimonadaceae bacterium]